VIKELLKLLIGYDYTKKNTKSSNQDTYIKGNGILKSRKEFINRIRRIDLNGNINCEIVRDNSNTIELSTDENILNYIKFSMDNDNLTVSSSGAVLTTRGTNVLIKSEEILEIVNKGTLKLKYLNVCSSRIAFENTGSASIVLSGECDEIAIVSTGNMDVNMISLQSKKSFVKLNGTGVLELSKESKAKYQGMIEIKTEKE
jgi:hypothetical protein